MSRILIKNIDINKMLVSNKVCFGKNCLSISLAVKMLPKLDIYDLYIFLLKMNAYRRDSDESRYFFWIKNDGLLGKYNEILENVNKSIKKEFDSEPICKEKISEN